jgi:hypothetical protein
METVDQMKEREAREAKSFALREKERRNAEVDKARAEEERRKAERAKSQPHPQVQARAATHALQLQKAHSRLV